MHEQITPLICAAYKRNFEIVALLLRCPAIDATAVIRSVTSPFGASLARAAPETFAMIEGWIKETVKVTNPERTEGKMKLSPFKRTR
jgi:hypothetical protein